MITLCDDDIVEIADLVLRPTETIMELLVLKDLIDSSFVEWVSGDIIRLVNESVQSELAIRKITDKVDELHGRLRQYHDNHQIL